MSLNPTPLVPPANRSLPRRVELWAGPEASVVRVGDRRCDQTESTGFATRLDDLDRLAGLGVRQVRMPVLWERTSTPSGELDFTWADSRMQHLRGLPMQPIVGLLHHGSGPDGTHLLDPAFPERLADYAQAVAERYPWVTSWTPVNEPLTTARFSGLYGVWYPHRRDDAAFVRALLNQIHGIRLAMQRIRAVVPGAQLVQTEDLGRTTGTRRMASQVRFDNDRRWLSLDLLVGRVVPGHPLWRYLRASGADVAELELLAAEPTPPSIVGINHYVTSDRFLDDRLDHYPLHLHGSNRHLRYADVEAVRVRGGSIGGFGARLREAARRYGLPLAMTEVQMGCTREEQLRWFHEAWLAAERLLRDGIDVRAVTAWAAFGAHDWDSLLTEQRGRYEPGLFDVRGPAPRPTALAALARDLARGTSPIVGALPHPVLQSPGWWHRAERLAYPAHGPAQSQPAGGPPLLITGARGTLAQAHARACRQRGLPYVLLGRSELDIADPVSVQAALDRWQPWAVINTAGFVRVDDAEDDRRQWRDNAEGPLVLASACRRRAIRLVTFSSDLVFDGQQCEPYRESDRTNPLNAYGHAKRHVEQALQAQPHVLAIRTAAFFGPWDAHNFVTQCLQALQRGDPWWAIDDQTVSPTYVPDLVGAGLDLLIDGECGVWHLTNPGAVSWYELACQAAEHAGLARDGVRRINTIGAGQRAVRPVYSALTSERGALMPPLHAALGRHVRDGGRGLAEQPPAAVYGCSAFDDTVPAALDGVPGLGLVSG